MSGLTENQTAMLKALSKKSWMVSDCTSGQRRTVNNLIARGLVEIQTVAGLRFIRPLKEPRP
jgi:hypothetical protein